VRERGREREREREKEREREREERVCMYISTHTTFLQQDTRSVCVNTYTYAYSRQISDTHIQVVPARIHTYITLLQPGTYTCTHPYNYPHPTYTRTNTYLKHILTDTRTFSLHTYPHTHTYKPTSGCCSKTHKYVTCAHSYKLCTFI